MHTNTNMISTYLVKQYCQLTDELTGNLWYVHTGGEKATDIEQHGIFLVRATYPEGANPDNFAHYDVDTPEAWEQLAQPYDAPYEDKLRSFREAGVLWLATALNPLPLLVACSAFRAPCATLSKSASIHPIGRIFLLFPPKNIHFL